MEPNNTSPTQTIDLPRQPPNYLDIPFGYPGLSTNRLSTNNPQDVDERVDTVDNLQSTPETQQNTNLEGMFNLYVALLPFPFCLYIQGVS